MDKDFDNNLNEGIGEEFADRYTFTPDNTDDTAEQPVQAETTTTEEPVQPETTPVEETAQPNFAPQGNPVFGNAYQNQPFYGYGNNQSNSQNGTYPYGGFTSAQSTPVTDAKKSKKKAKKEKKQGGIGKIIAVALCCSLVGGVVGGLAMRSSKTSHSNSGSTVIMEGERETKDIEINKIDTSEVLTAAELYAANVNSTVGITTTITYNYWGYKTSAAAAGSGFIITADGYVLTNYHVIEDSTSITVTTYDDEKYDAEIIGYDESNDVAVLKIDAEDLTPVVLGDSDKLNVGDEVIAIGNPLGELTFSLTKGVVSALDRSVTTSDNITMNLIQTDCAINSGNSGGALFNMYGEVVGITNAKYSGSSDSSEASIDNIGFAIPMANVKSIVMSIIEKGYISKPYIGVAVMTVSDDSVELGLPEGAAVKEITEDGPADKAGIQLNDIITEVNGTAISSADELVSMVGDMEIGDELQMTIYRSGETLTITLTVEEKVQSATADETDDTTDSSSSGNYDYDNGYGNGYGNYGGYGNYDSFEDFFGQFFGNYY